LPQQVIEAFRQKIADIGFVTSSDIIPLGSFARQLTRTNIQLWSVPSPLMQRLTQMGNEIAVRAKRYQNMMRSLHQQRAQIRIAFLADVHLRLALARVSPSWLQSEIAAHVPTFTEMLRSRSVTG
jgi:hypothetical protein